MYERVWDPAIVFARRMLEDPEFAPLLAPALTAKLPQGPPTSAALATAMHAVALEIGPATMVRRCTPMTCMATCAQALQLLHIAPQHMHDARCLRVCAITVHAP